MTTQQTQFLTPDEAADVLEIDAGELLEAADRRRIPHYRFPSGEGEAEVLRFAPADLAAWQQRRGAEA